MTPGKQHTLGPCLQLRYGLPYINAGMHADEPAPCLTRSAHFAGLMQKARLYSKRMSRSASRYVNPCCSGPLTPHDAALHAVQQMRWCNDAKGPLALSDPSSCSTDKERCKATVRSTFCNPTSTSADLIPAGCCAFKATQQVLKNADSCTACWTTTVGNSKCLEPARTPYQVELRVSSQDSCLYLLLGT